MLLNAKPSFKPHCGFGGVVCILDAYNLFNVVESFACLYVHYVHAWYTRRSEKDQRVSGNVAIDGYDQPQGCWKLLQEQQVLLTAEPSSLSGPPSSPLWICGLLMEALTICVSSLPVLPSLTWTPLLCPMLVLHHSAQLESECFFVAVLVLSFYRWWWCCYGDKVSLRISG